jgi:hypothetical protein
VSAQQLRRRTVTDRNSVLLEQFVRQCQCALARPAQRRLGIAPRHWIDELLQRGPYLWMRHFVRALASAASNVDDILAPGTLTRFVPPLSHRADCQAGGAGHRRDAPASVPAHNRRARSSIVAFSRRHFCRTNFSAFTPNVDHDASILSIGSAYFRVRFDRLGRSGALSAKRAHLSDIRLASLDRHAAGDRQLGSSEPIGPNMKIALTQTARS